MGTLIDTKSGSDAIRDALGAVQAQRGSDARPWALAIGAGTYGDAAITQRNLTVAADPPGSAVIAGYGGTNDTGGGCIDITRGPVTLDGIVCRGASRTGVNVTPPNAEGGIVLRGIAVDGAGVDGIAVTGGTGIVIADAVVTATKRDGIRLAALTAAGPYAITGGWVSGAGQDGLRLADDVARLDVTNFRATGNGIDGIASEDSGTSDISLVGVTASSNARNGVLIGGGGLRIGLRDSVVSGNAGAGVRLGNGSGFSLSGMTLDGSNGAGDLLFTADSRTGGTYVGLDAGGGFSLIGEPSAVRVSGVPAARMGIVAPTVGGRARSGAALSIGATAVVASRRAVVRFDRGAAVWRGAGKWTKVPSSRRIRGGMQAILGTSLLGTARATYAPFG